MKHTHLFGGDFQRISSCKESEHPLLPQQTKGLIMYLYQGLTALAILWGIRISIHTYSVGWHQGQEFFMGQMVFCSLIIALCNSKRHIFSSILILGTTLIGFITLFSTIITSWSFLNQSVRWMVVMLSKITGIQHVEKLDVIFVCIALFIVGMMFIHETELEEKQATVHTENTTEKSMSETTVDKVEEETDHYTEP